jgi:hypothetical protein
MPFARGWLDEAVSTATAALGPDAFDNAWRDGAALPLPDAVARAMRLPSR